MLDPTVAAASIAGLVSLLAALLAARGRKEEVEGSNLRALIEGQSKRIDQQQRQQEATDKRVDKLEQSLSQERLRSDRLFAALESLVVPIRELDEWVQSGAKPPPPTMPNADRLQALLEENARNPPT